MKLCRDCANARQIGGTWDCHAEGNMVDDLVRGGKHARFLPDFLRESDSHCGVHAKWFVPRALVAAK